MKFLPIFLSLLSIAALSVASPVGGDPSPGLLAIIAGFLGLLAGNAPPAPAPAPAPADPAPADPPATPIPAGFARCAVIGKEKEKISSLSCPGGPKCTEVKVYTVGDLIEFKCYLQDGAKPPQPWVRIQEPWGYFPRISVDQDCAKKITAVCPEQ